MVEGKVKTIPNPDREISGGIKYHCIALVAIYRLPAGRYHRSNMGADVCKGPCEEAAT